MDAIDGIRAVFSTEGRASRSEFISFSVIFPWVFGILFFLVNLLAGSGTVSVIVATFFAAAQAWGLAAVGSRRCQDLNEPGWMVYTMLIPGYNVYRLGRMALCKGTAGDNDYGPVPTGREIP